jgi:hypothetical protein
MHDDGIVRLGLRNVKITAKLNATYKLRNDTMGSMNNTFVGEWKLQAWDLEYLPLIESAFAVPW